MKKKIRQLIRSLLPYHPERLYLFGSWARGEEDEMSDIDLVVIKQTSTPFLERLREVSSLLPAEIGGVVSRRARRVRRADPDQEDW